MQHSADPSNGKTIWVFTPSRTAPEDLEFILVQRQALLQDAVERVRESALTGNKHHLLFVGPRGCGKTHFVTLAVSRLGADEALAERLRIAWLNEDETCTTLLELLLKVHAALEKRYPGEYREDMLSDAYDMKPDAALKFVSQHILSTLGSRTLLIVCENLDAIFEGLGDSGQKQLRSFIQEHPQFSLLATAQRLVEDLSERTSPFFGFFQTEHLKPLNVEQATELLQKIARLQNKKEVVAFLATSRGRSRVRAIHHLSGGNHRIYIVLAQFITRDSVDALLEPFMKMVDELTPYYQERIRWLPPLQRKIVEYLCTCEGTVPVKEIAKKLFSSPQTISSQLQDLREKGYLESNQRGRESLYEISEPLMRICIEVKDNQRLQPLRLLVDFLRVWYDDHELKHRLGKMEPASAACAYLTSAIQRNSAEGNLRVRMMLEELGYIAPHSLPPDLLAKLTKNMPEALLISAQCSKDGDKEGAIDCLTESIVLEQDPEKIGHLLILRAMLFNAEMRHENAIDDFTTVIGLCSAPVEQVSVALFYRGCTYGERGDANRAIDDYTSLIELSGAPVEQVVMALVNRGIIYGKSNKMQFAINDFTAVIDVPGQPMEQIALALYNRGNAFSEIGETQRAIDDYTAVIESPNLPVKQVAVALINRGLCRGNADEARLAVNDFTKAVELPDAPVEQVAMALFNRGLTHGLAGETQDAINDFTKLAMLPGASAEQIATALFNRGSLYNMLGDLHREIDDCTEVIGLPGAPMRQVVMALYNRGNAYGELDIAKLAIDDYTAVIEHSEASVEEVAMSFVNRGIIYEEIGDDKAAIGDFTRVIGLSAAPVEQVAMALINRGSNHGKAGDTQYAIDDFTKVIELQGAPVEQVVMALMNRGIAYSLMDEKQCEIDDYTAAVNLPGASVDQVAMALFYRGITHNQTGETGRAIDDFTMVIELSDASSDQVAKALVNRGITYGEVGDIQREIDDYNAAIELSGAQIEQVATALYLRGVTYLQQGRKQESQDDLEALIRLPDAPIRRVVDASFFLTGLHLSEGRWNEAFKALESSLECGAKVQPAYCTKPTDLIGILFAAGLSHEGRREKVAELLRLYQKHQALPVLGEGLIQHLGNVFRAGEPFPSSDNLEGWASAWEQAAENVPDFRLSLRLMRTSIQLLKAGGKDRAILLDLASAERSIVEQAMGLADES